jgi:hypothetical protein
VTAGKLDITVESGAAFLESFLIQDCVGNTLDLTGCSAAMQVRSWVGNPTALLTLTSVGGGLVIDAPNGTITPVISGDALLPGSYVYDLKLTDSGGQVFRLIQGNINFIEQVTTI